MTTRPDETTRDVFKTSGRPSASSVRVKQLVSQSLRAVADPASAAVAIDVAINAGCDAVRDARRRKIDRENIELKRDLAESRASEQVFRAEVTRLRQRLGDVER